MKIKYDSKADIINFTLSDAKVSHSHSFPGQDFTINYDEEFGVVGMTIQNASENRLFEKFILAAITSLEEEGPSNVVSRDPLQMFRRNPGNHDRPPTIKN